MVGGDTGPFVGFNVGAGDGKFVSSFAMAFVGGTATIGGG